tara:strand:+ start:203 stop:1771 length:1569 start_codon:yes stop_codon:yes gene_type:complete
MKIAVLVFGIIGCIFAGAFVFGILTVTAVSDITQSINGENDTSKLSEESDNLKKTAALALAQIIASLIGSILFWKSTAKKNQKSIWLLASAPILSLFAGGIGLSTFFHGLACTLALTDDQNKESNEKNFTRRLDIAAACGGLLIISFFLPALSINDSSVSWYEGVFVTLKSKNTENSFLNYHTIIRGSILMAITLMPLFGLISIISRNKKFQMFSGVLTVIVLLSVFIDYAIRANNFPEITILYGSILIAAPMFFIIHPLRESSPYFAWIAVCLAAIVSLLFPSSSFSFGSGFWLILIFGVSLIVAPSKTAKKTATVIACFPALVLLALISHKFSQEILAPSIFSISDQEDQIYIENRKGLYYKPGQDTPFSGTIQRKHKNGRQSFEAVYANGLKLLQRSWYNNGAPNDEYRFHEGHIVVRHDWDDTGKLQAWRKLELLTQEQFVRAAQYATNKPPDLQKAYLWFHIAAANGHLDSRQLLRNPPEGITQEEFAKVKLKADQLLGNESKKSGNLTDQNASKKR